MPKDLLTVVRSTKYALDAFLFVEQGLAFTVQRTHGPAKTGSNPVDRHVSGQDLCRGLRDYAMQQYGLLARTVLRRWGINACEDFGHIVFAMVDAKLMSKTDEDSIQDFIGVFDFADGFADTLQLSEN